MELQLDSKFKLTLDSPRLNIQLEKLEPIKDKKTQEIVRYDYKILGYFGHSLGAALRRYKDEAILDAENLNKINDVLDKMKELERTIDRVVRREQIKMDSKTND